MGFTQSPRVTEEQYKRKFKLKFVRILMTHPVYGTVSFGNYT